MLGWLLAMCSLLPIPVLIIFKMIMTPGPLLKRFISLTQPSTKWGPALEIHRTGRYKAVTVLNDPDEQSSLNMVDDPEKQDLDDLEKQPFDLDVEKQPLDSKSSCEKIAIEYESYDKSCIA